MGSANRSILGAMATLALVLAAPPAQAQPHYGPGVTDSEIKIGNTTPYSGPGIGLFGRCGVRGRLFRDDQRSGRREWPQNRFHQSR